MTQTLFGFPVLPQAGLGNMLVPWADCLLWCLDNNAQMISPFWTKLRVGPWLRRERDKRSYHRFFVPADQIHGLQRLILLAISRRTTAEAWRAGLVSSTTDERTVVLFSDMYVLSKNLVGRHDEVRSALYRMTKPCYHPTDFTDGRPFVGVHVRLGDYPPESDSGGVIYRLPLTWYVECLQEIRRALAVELPAVVFSDGSDAELSPLLDMPAVSRSPFREAITDMLALAESAVLITSRSTFSLWGAYLGQIPSVWYPKKDVICGDGVLAGDGAHQLEIEWLIGDPLPSGFVRAIRDQLEYTRCPPNKYEGT